MALYKSVYHYILLLFSAVIWRYNSIVFHDSFPLLRKNAGFAVVLLFGFNLMSTLCDLMSDYLYHEIDT